MRWPWSRERRRPDDEVFVPAKLYPDIFVTVDAELLFGTCGWWPNEVAYADNRPGDYVRLKAGAYTAEAVELPDGRYALVSGIVDREPGIGVKYVPSMSEARRVFQRLVEDELRRFVHVTYREVE